MLFKFHSILYSNLSHAGLSLQISTSLKSKRYDDGFMARDGMHNHMNRCSDCSNNHNYYAVATTSSSS